MRGNPPGDPTATTIGAIIGLVLSAIVRRTIAIVRAAGTTRVEVAFRG